jgi:hypothetical protein
VGRATCAGAPRGRWLRAEGRRVKEKQSLLVIAAFGASTRHFFPRRDRSRGRSWRCPAAPADGRPGSAVLHRTHRALQLAPADRRLRLPHAVRFVLSPLRLQQGQQGSGVSAPAIPRSTPHLFPRKECILFWRLARKRVRVRVLGPASQSPRASGLSERCRAPRCLPSEISRSMSMYVPLRPRAASWLPSVH